MTICDSVSKKEEDIFKGIYFALAATFEDFVKAHATGNGENDTRAYETVNIGSLVHCTALHFNAM